MTSDSEPRFAAYVEALSTAVGHADRTGPFRDYCLGLLMPGERKSVEPMSAVTSPARVSAQHQSLLQGLAKVRDLVLPSMQRSGPIAAWIIDDTGFPKKGKHSVGVTRQYCGQLGKQDNCQVAVSLSIAHHSASLPVAYQLYLPEDWAKDRECPQECARRGRSNGQDGSWHVREPSPTLPWFFQNLCPPE